MILQLFPKLTRAAFAAAALMILASACSPNPNGQGVADFGTVTGTIVDAKTNQPISGATVSIGNVVQLTAASDNGVFTLRMVPIGTNTIRISAIGWQTYSANVRVLKDQTTALDAIGLVSANQ